MKKLNEIANRFQIRGEIDHVAPLGEGFINETYIAKTKSDKTPDYLLQRKNKYIFKDVPGMMENILKVTSHLKKKITEAGGDPERETLTLTLTKTNELYTLDDENEYWTMCLLIEDHKVYDTADTLDLARAGGEGIGKFQSLLADFHEPLIDTLPGFHNIKFRFEQWDETLKNDAAGRSSDLKEEINWIESRREDMMKFWDLIETGQIPKRITHNDTKISNILFDNNNDVLCVIDLDTVLSSTVLNDFGDAIRSYTNTGKEDDKDLSKVGLNMDIFKAYAEGYLSQTQEFLSDIEIEYLAFSGIFITYEQTLRFLMDYIDGDKYYKIHYPEHNLVRTKAQNKLLNSMEANYEEMKNVIRNLVKLKH